MKHRILMVMGEIVWYNARAAMTPQIQESLQELNVKSKLIFNRIKKKVYDEAEHQVRKHVAVQFENTYVLIQSTLLPSGRKHATEEGPRHQLDDCGFLVSSGGYQAFKRAGQQEQLTGDADEFQLAAEIIDEPILEKLESLLQELEPLLQSCQDKALEVKMEYFTNIEENTDNTKSKRGILGLIPGVGTIKGFIPDPKALLKFIPGNKGAAVETVPTALFLKAGLASIVETVQSILHEIGGAAAQRAKTSHVTVEDRSSDLRREMDQLLQELVVARAREIVFSELDTRVKKQSTLALAQQQRVR
eukprot:SAG31_NODE_10863_length_1089_cov_1.251515_1_plen_303_part_10